MRVPAPTLGPAPLGSKPPPEGPAPQTQHVSHASSRRLSQSTGKVSTHPTRGGIGGRWRAISRRRSISRRRRRISRRWRRIGRRWRRRRRFHREIHRQVPLVQQHVVVPPDAEDDRVDAGGAGRVGLEPGANLPKMSSNQPQICPNMPKYPQSMPKYGQFSVRIRTVPSAMLQAWCLGKPKMPVATHGMAMVLAP